MNEYIKHFDTLNQAEGYEIREVPFSGYIKEPHLALFSKRWGDIKEGNVSYDRYLFYTTNDGSTIGRSWDSSEFPQVLEYTYLSGEGVTVFNGSIPNIEDSAFQGCTSLTSITIPNSVTSIGNEAFSGCDGLTSVTIPNNVTKIGDYAFKGCLSLASVTIPKSVTNIGRYAFYTCSSLTSVIIPNSVTSIGMCAFEQCSSLTSVTIGNSVTNIGGGAFQGCSSLTSITIPNSVTSIGIAVFSNCSSLTSITCEATTPPTLGSNNTFSYVMAVYVPAESVNLYKQATNWSYYASKIQPIQ